MSSAIAQKQNKGPGLFSNVKNDVIAGITVSVVALPLALAFGVASGLGAVAGLYGAIFCGFFASLFGGTKAQVTGPTGPMTVVTATVVGTYGREYALLAILLAGFLQIIFGLLKLGSLVRLIPYPVVSGFMDGIAVIIIMQQKDYFLQAPLVAIVTMILMWVIPRINKKLPASLLALIFGTLFAIYIAPMFEGSFLVRNIETIGAIPQGLPKFSFPKITDWSVLQNVISPAFTLAILGSIDSLLTSVVVDGITNSKHNSNKELIGQGIGNAVSSLFGGMGGAGATVRSVVNVREGGQTPLSGMVHSIMLLMVLLVLAPIASIIPMSVLAGILIVTGLGMFDIPGIKDMKIQPITDTIIMLLTFVLTVAVDLIVAVGVGMLFACLFFIRDMGKLRVSEKSLDTLPISDVIRVNAEECGLKVCSVDGPLFFGTAEFVSNLLQAQRGEKYLVIDIHHVEVMDATGAKALRDSIIKLQEQDIMVTLAGMPKRIEKIMNRMQVIETVKPSRCFKFASEAVVYSVDYNELISGIKGDIVRFDDEDDNEF